MSYMLTFFFVLSFGIKLAKAAAIDYKCQTLNYINYVKFKY